MYVVEIIYRLWRSATTTYLVVSGRLNAALSFCIAWLDAGGEIDNQEYREKVAMVQELTPLNEQLAGEVDSIRHAAWEWCEKNKIPTDFFSGPLCHLPMPKEVEEQSDMLDVSLIEKAHEYLKTCPTRAKLSPDYFLNSFTGSAVYQAL